MKGDFSRNTFNKHQHFLRVLMQQGRVQLDADWNEQVSILLHYLHALAEDIIGPYAGPTHNPGFEIKNSSDPKDFMIGMGRYYVNGILCENEMEGITFKTQPDYPAPEDLNKSQIYLVYLDVWERHITYLEDQSIREVALGGPDTATRSQVVWQVKTTFKLENGETNISDRLTLIDASYVHGKWGDWIEQWQPTHRGLLKAMSKKDESISEDPCITPPEARYRGAENQLYRVEIHTGSKGKDGGPTEPTFKWSQENGSVIFPILEIIPGDPEYTVTLAHLGKDDKLGLRVNDWVEIVDDEYVLHNRAEALLKVSSINRDDMEVTLEGMTTITVQKDPSNHPLLRRWDHQGKKTSDGDSDLINGAVPLEEGKPLNLEEGIQILFDLASDGAHVYRSGDYWLIPARTATRDVEWPKETDAEGKLIKEPNGDLKPLALPPRGITHHYAPLAIISVDSVGNIALAAADDCRRQFGRLGNGILRILP